mmetsp:Transcript_10118/g.13247  ORF Transcript_10118/g.13247 Transcript_10118/m.13247 type:complete len:582 (-) Transcript_10118:383-2128(-)|eukprot:CAMPEP_0117821440 /NCGR_PEP_ID=MMETSP0949-20121206/3061_1 /TAXON_ID=44440 /ORGANISM="Chattonella subsalsa, Strain CCMP2191" /LENGTH=581 /DNA_ID=CAMNT_0005660579 /DNA_START=49 /DNA_END=1797 /DNA_ORIENTATION=+
MLQSENFISFNEYAPETKVFPFFDNQNQERHFGTEIDGKLLNSKNIVMFSEHASNGLESNHKKELNYPILNIGSLTEEKEDLTQLDSTKHKNNTLQKGSPTSSSLQLPGWFQAFDKFKKDKILSDIEDGREGLRSVSISPSKEAALPNKITTTEACPNNEEEACKPSRGQRTSTKNGWLEWQEEMSTQVIAEHHGLNVVQVRELFDYCARLEDQMENNILPNNEEQILKLTEEIDVINLESAHEPEYHKWKETRAPKKKKVVEEAPQSGVALPTIATQKRVFASPAPGPTMAAPCSQPPLLQSTKEKDKSQSLSLDSDPSGEPFSCNEYATDIFAAYRIMELETKVAPRVIDQQPYLTDKMRAILVDWLVELHLACNKKYRLSPETLHLAVSIIDRYLFYETVSRKNFQLLGAAAFLIASKYEDIYPPYLTDLCYYTDGAYNGDQIMAQEAQIAKVLKFRFSLPTIYMFLLRYLKAGHANKGTVQVANYMAEQALHENNLLRFLPSMVAACCVYVARKHQNRQPWSSLLCHHTGYSEQDLQECLVEMSNCFWKRNQVKAVHRKFGAQKFGCIAKQQIQIFD